MTNRRLIAPLGLCLLTLAACNRPAATAPADPAPATGAPGADVTATGTAPVNDPSGPLPDRKTPLVVTAYEPQVIGNVYRTDFQDLIIDRWDEAGAGGRYALGQGRFDGVRHKGSDGPDGIDTIEGYWIQPTSDHPCETERDGSRYWGKIQFNFDRARKGFIGFWSFCDGTPLDRWNGELDHRDAAVAREVEALMAAGPGAGAAQ
ncbi:MAG: hypothetical protein GC145_17025 [Caulobacter sp.]|nr:hypothetical protein [Caulobacter sp.]